MQVEKVAKTLALQYGKTVEDRKDIEIICLEAAWNASKKVQSELNPEGYTFKAMKNAALIYTRGYKEPIETPIDNPICQTIEAPFSEDTLIDQIVLKEQITKFISTLVSPEKDIIELLLDGYSLVEIAQKLNLTPTSVSVKLYRKKNVWREMLGL